MMAAHRKLIIQRETWMRGILQRNLLLNGKGHRCCLGFAAEQPCGAEPHEILDRPDPLAAVKVFRRGLPELFDHQVADRLSHLGFSLIRANDGPLYATDSEREDQIKRLFSYLKVDVEFVGERKPYGRRS